MVKRDSKGIPTKPAVGGHKQNLSVVDTQGPTSFTTLYNKRTDNAMLESAFERMQLHKQVDRQNIEALRRLNN